MCAVSEAAAARKLLNVGKSRVYSIICAPHAEFAHAGSVDKRCAAGEREKLAACGGVSAAVVVSQAAGSKKLFAEQTVYKRGFSNA